MSFFSVLMRLLKDSRIVLLRQNDAANNCFLGKFFWCGQLTILKRFYGKYEPILVSFYASEAKPPVESCCFFIFRSKTSINMVYNESLIRLCCNFHCFSRFWWILTQSEKHSPIILSECRLLTCFNDCSCLFLDTFKNKF